jgi:hypothetical protein
VRCAVPTARTFEAESPPQTYQQLVVHRFDDDLLGLVLAHVEPQFQEFVLALILDKRGAESVQPSPHVTLLRVG